MSVSSLRGPGQVWLRMLPGGRHQPVAMPSPTAEKSWMSDRLPVSGSGGM